MPHILLQVEEKLSTFDRAVLRQLATAAGNESVRRVLRHQDDTSNGVTASGHFDALGFPLPRMTKIKATTQCGGAAYVMVMDYSPKLDDCEVAIYWQARGEDDLQCMKASAIGRNCCLDFVNEAD